jgi:hypothetical protein
MSIPYVTDGVTDLDSALFNPIIDAINGRAFVVPADGDIQDALDLAAAVSGDGRFYRKAVVSLTQGATYEITAPLIVKSQVHIEGNGARIHGPITGAGRITSATAIPSATDVAGQTAGACFTDDEDFDAVLNWPSFSDLVIDNFRFGFVSKCYAWAHPQFDRIDFHNTDIGFFVYQGAQHWTINDPGIGFDSHCMFAAAATCFTASHPYAGIDNYFCDGLKLNARRQTLNCSYNGDVDSWFENAILRPASTSVSVGGSTTFSPTGTFRKVTGRAIYAPSRNPRNLYGWEVGPLSMYDSPRGAALLRYPVDGTFRDIAGELLFRDATVNTGPDESVLVVGVRDVVSSASFTNIDADNSASGLNYKGAIDIVAEHAQSYTLYTGIQITGWTDPRYYTLLDQFTTTDGGVTGRNLAARAMLSRPSVVADAAAGTLDVTTAYLKLSQASVERITDNEDHELRRQFFADRLPLAGGAQTKAFFNISGNDGEDTDGLPIVGTLRLYIQRLDSGAMDFAEYQVALSQRFAQTTLTSNIATNDTTIPVASGAALLPGTPITVDGAQTYLVEERSGGTLTLSQPVTANQTSGEAVVGVTEITRTLIALANAWVAVGIESNMLRITNSIDPVPIRFSGLFEYPRAAF